MPFYELLQNTDILITVSPVANQLSGCLPMTGIPYELSLGNRPLLWHCLAPLVDAGGLNFFIAVLPEWQAPVRAALKNFADHYHLRTNITAFTEETTNDDKKSTNTNATTATSSSSSPTVLIGNDGDQQQEQQPPTSAGPSDKRTVHVKEPTTTPPPHNNSNNNNTATPSSSTISASASSARQSFYNGDVNFTLVVVEEAAVHESQDVAQVVHYARHHRSADNIKDFLVVNFDTLLSPEVITTFTQGFHTNFATASVLHLERDAKEEVTDYLCIDDPVEHTPPACPGAMFAEHRRLHLSEPLPCDPEHSLRASLLMRRPQMIFTKKFKQLPVFMFRPWVAQALVLHYDAVNAQQQRRKENIEQQKQNQQQQNNANNATNSKKKNKQNNANNSNIQEEETILQMFKFREDMIPSLTLWQFSSLVALPQEYQHSSRKLRFRSITSADRMMEELAIPASTNFKIKSHWCLSSSVSSVYSTSLPQHQQSTSQQQQNNNNNSGEANNSNNNNINNINDDQEGEIPQENNHNHAANRASQQQLVSSSFASVLLPTPTIDVLNATGPSLPSSTDEVRVFATLVRRSDYVTTTAAKDESSSTATATNNNNNETTTTTTCQNVFPIAKRIDSAESYKAVAAMLKQGLEINPAPAVVNSIQKYSVPDMHKETFDLLIQDQVDLQEHILNLHQLDSASTCSGSHSATPSSLLQSLLQQQQKQNYNNNNNSNNSSETSAAILQLLNNVTVPASLQRCGLLSVPPCVGTFSNVAANVNACRVERSIIGRNVKFAEGCVVIESVVMDDVEVGERSVLKGCIVGPRTTVKPEERYEDAILSGHNVDYI